MNFFRRIRQQLFKDNRASQYLLYALGEMTLVILGILIALQINNWNEDRKATALGQEMVAEIKSGLKSDLEEFQRFIFFQQTVMKSQAILLGWLQSDHAFNDSLSQHIRKVYMTTDYAVNYAGYETLKQFGLRRIKDDSLRTSIADLYEIKYPRFIKYTNIYQRFLEELLQSNPKHFTELNYMQARMAPMDASKIKTDQKYTYDLNTLKNFNQLLIFQGAQLHEEMTTTYAMME